VRSVNLTGGFRTVWRFLCFPPSQHRQYAVSTNNPGRRRQAQLRSVAHVRVHTVRDPAEVK
jgi:hypothetical protein